MATNIGTGTLITFSSGFLAEIREIRAGFERAVIDFSHMATTVARIFKAGDLYDPGILEVDILYDPTKAPPITGAFETVTITHRETSLSIAGSGCLIGFDIGIPLEDARTATARIKYSGVLTFDITP
jgi:hypothetical protein